VHRHLVDGLLGLTQRAVREQGREAVRRRRQRGGEGQGGGLVPSGHEPSGRADEGLDGALRGVGELRWADLSRPLPNSTAKADGCATEKRTYAALTRTSCSVGVGASPAAACRTSPRAV
jgi:hypothetical protein